MRPGGAWALAGVGVAGGVIVAILVASALESHGACAGSLAESEITVRIVGDAAAVHDVRLCTEAGCSRPALVEVEREGQGDAVSATPATGAEATPTIPPSGSAGALLPEFPTGPETPAPTPVPAAPASTSSGSGTSDVDSQPRFAGIVYSTPRQWVFTVGLAHPDRITVTAYGSDGRRIGARTAHLEWVSAQTTCPSADVTGTVALHVGS